MKKGFIHPSAIVEPGAKIDESAEIGPLCYIASNVVIGANCHLISQVTILGNTTLGKDNVIYPGACLGAGAQDHEYMNEPNARLVIGDNNVIREYVTINAGTPKGQIALKGEEKVINLTQVGSNCFIMSYVHIGHDCRIGNYVTVASGCLFAGHVRIGDRVTIGGNVSIHQFCIIFEYAMIAGQGGLGGNVPPFCTTDHGAPARLAGVNTIGMERNDFDKKSIQAVRRAYINIFMSKKGTLDDRLKEAKEEFAAIEAVQKMISSIEKVKDLEKPMRPLLTAKHY